MVLFLMILNFSFLVDEFCDMMIRIGNLCIDLFYIIGKISVCVVLYNMKDGYKKINMLFLIKIEVFVIIFYFVVFKSFNRLMI